MIDNIRILVLVNACLLGLMCVYLVVSGPGLDFGTRTRFFGVVLFAAFAITLEARRFGHPVTPDTFWIQPMLALTSLTFEVGVLIGAKTNWRARS